MQEITDPRISQDPGVAVAASASCPLTCDHLATAGLHSIQHYPQTCPTDSRAGQATTLVRHTPPILRGRTPRTKSALHFLSHTEVSLAQWTPPCSIRCRLMKIKARRPPHTFTANTHYHVAGPLIGRPRMPELRGSTASSNGTRNRRLKGHLPKASQSRIQPEPEKTAMFLRYPPPSGRLHRRDQQDRNAFRVCGSAGGTCSPQAA